MKVAVEVKRRDLREIAEGERTAPDDNRKVSACSYCGFHASAKRLSEMS